MRDREREHTELPLPQGRVDRLLLALGAGALLAVVPMLWLWLLYGAAVGPATRYAAGIGLSIIALAIGLAMIRILDEGK